MALLEDCVNLQAAVLDAYGVRLPEIAADGRMKAFPIDQFRIGFVLSFGDVYVFGCRTDGDIYYFDGQEWHGFEVEVLRPPKQEFNRMVIECAKGLIARGEVLNAVDAARLKLAVEQVEANS
jgi:hypothetical protein